MDRLLSRWHLQGLPVIATHWSGVTEYLDEEVGYPLSFTMQSVSRTMSQEADVLDSPGQRNGLPTEFHDAQPVSHQCNHR